MLIALLRRMRYSFKYRIAAIIFLLEALMMGIVLSVTLGISQSETEKQLSANEQVLHQLLSKLSRVALLTAEYDELQPYIEEVVQDPHVNLVLLANRRGRVVVSNDHALIGKPLPEFQNEANQYWLTRNIDNSSGQIGMLAIRFSHAQLMEANREARAFGISVAFVGMTLIAIVGILIGHLLTRRLDVLADTAQRLANGEENARTGLTGHDEVAIVGKAFDSMAQSVGENVETLRRLTDLLELRVAERTQELARMHDEAVSANRSKSAFLANMSHEIRTPLTAIIGFSEALLDSKQPLAERIDAIRTINRSGKHLLRIINDILDVSKIEADRLDVEKVDVNPFEIMDDVTAIVSLLAEDKGLRFDVEYNYPLPARIISDPLRLKQILINLCNNAIKFTAQGGVTVQVASDPQHNTIRFQVQDTGIGMTPEQTQHLFRAFSQADVSITREFGGTGLGLYLSQQLASRLGGHISVESKSGQGSRFTLTMATGPQTDDILVNSRPSPARKQPPYADGDLHVSGKVLLVEDNIDNQKLISLLLRRAGIDVVLADNGQIAVEMALQQKYDLILMDIQMPVMSGLEAIQKLRQESYKGTVIALTANATREDTEACIAAGFDDFMSKPIDRSRLHEALSRHLHKGSDPRRSLSPIASSLLSMDPSLLDLVTEFVARLRGVISEIKTSHQQRDYTTLKKQVHSLKGSSGNFGYNDLFKLCQTMEFELAKSNDHGIGLILEEMSALVTMIEMGVPDLAQSNIRARSHKA